MSTNAQLKSELKNFDERVKAAHDFADPLVAKLVLPENRARMEKIVSLIDQYAKAAKDIGALKAKALEAEAKQAAAEVADLESKQNAVIQGPAGTLASAAESDRLIDEIIAIAKKLHADKVSQADAAMAFAERLGLGLGLLTTLILVASAFLGAFTIAKPLKALVQPLEEVAAGNCAITVPGAGRRDEVGQIAEAVQQMAHKVSATIGEIKGAADEAKTFVANAQGIVDQVKAGKGALGALVFDENTANNFKTSVQNLRDVSDKIAKGEGTLGKLINDDSLFRDVQGTLKKADRALDGLDDAGPINAVGVVAKSLF